MPRVSKAFRAMNPITTGPGHVFSRQVKNIRIKAQEKRQVLIGSSASPYPPKGFAVNLKPAATPTDTVVTRIVTRGGGKHFDYILDITNTNNRTISAEVWQM